MYALFTHGAWSAVIRGSAHSPAVLLGGERMTETPQVRA
jgi:hypothetical protein